MKLEYMYIYIDRKLRDNEFELWVVTFGFIKNHFSNSLKFCRCLGPFHSSYCSTCIHRPKWIYTKQVVLINSYSNANHHIWWTLLHFLSLRFSQVSFRYIQRVQYITRWYSQNLIKQMHDFDLLVSWQFSLTSTKNVNVFLFAFVSNSMLCVYGSTISKHLFLFSLSPFSIFKEQEEEEKKHILSRAVWMSLVNSIIIVVYSLVN